MFNLRREQGISDISELSFVSLCREPYNDRAKPFVWKSISSSTETTCTFEKRSERHSGNGFYNRAIFLIDSDYSFTFVLSGSSTYCAMISSLTLLQVDRTSVKGQIIISEMRCEITGIRDPNLVAVLVESLHRGRKISCTSLDFVHFAVRDRRSEESL